MKYLKMFINRFVFMNEFELIHHPAKPDMNAFALQSVFGNMVVIATGGTFITGYLVYLGAPDGLVSYIGLLPSILGIFLVFLSLLVQRYSKPKAVVQVVNACAKVFMLSIIVVPFFVKGTTAIIVVFALYSIGHIFNSINNLMINNWFVKAIPGDIRGRFFSVRQIISMILNSFLPILAGMLTDSFSDKYHAFLILYSIGAALALLEVFSFSKIRDCKLDIIETKLNLLDVIRIPIKNKAFMGYVLNNGLFYFLLYLSASLRQLYMLKYLDMSYTFINAMGMVSFLLQALFFYKLWGRANDRLNPKFVMNTSMWFYGLDLLIWFIASPTTAFILLPVGHIVGAIEGPAFTIGSYNRRYEIIPEKGRTLYDAFYTSFIGLILIIAPFIGGLMKSLLVRTGLSDLMPLGDFRLMYLISALTLFGMQTFNYFKTKKAQPEDLALKKESYQEAAKCLFR